MAEPGWVVVVAPPAAMAEAPGAGVPAASLPAVPGWHGVDEPGEQNEVHLDGGEGADEDEEHGEGEEILLSDIALGRGSTDDEEGEVVDELVHIADECIRARLTEHEEDEEEGDGVDLAELASRQEGRRRSERGEPVLHSAHEAVQHGKRLFPLRKRHVSGQLLGGAAAPSAPRVQ